jgi:hypothetical protein
VLPGLISLSPFVLFVLTTTGGKSGAALSLISRYLMFGELESSVVAWELDAAESFSCSLFIIRPLQQT